MFKLLHSSLLCIYCEVIRMFGSLLGILEEGERVRDLGKILKHVLKIRHSFFKLKENTSLHWENHIQPNKKSYLGNQTQPRRSYQHIYRRRSREHAVQNSEPQMYSSQSNIPSGFYSQFYASSHSTRLIQRKWNNIDNL